MAGDLCEKSLDESVITGAFDVALEKYRLSLEQSGFDVVFAHVMSNAPLAKLQEIILSLL